MTLHFEPMAVMPFGVGALSYAASFGYLVHQLRRRQVVQPALAYGLIGLGLIAHGVTLWQTLITPLGLNLNLFNTLSLTSWLMLAFSLLFTVLRPVVGLNLLGLPLAAVGLALSSLLPVADHRAAPLSGGIEAHIVTSLAAYCVLLMAAIQAILLRLQNRDLKHLTSDRLWVSFLPPRQTMERLLLDMVGVGFASLTVALALGAWAVDDLLAQHVAHKTVFSVLSWLVFGTLLLGHWRFGWRGQRAARFTLWGFGLLAMGFVGTQLVLELILGR